MHKSYKLLISLILVVTLVFGSSLNVFAFKPRLYTDVDSGHWAYDAIQYVSKARYFNGYEDGTFNPSKTITRAEAAKVIVTLLYRDRVYDTLSFSDVTAEDWFAPYVEAGKDLFPNTEGGKLFRPNDFVTREDTIYALVRSLKLTHKVKFVDMEGLNAFRDSGAILPDTAPYLAMALQLSIISGYADNTVRPDAPLTRAEFATLIYRAKCVEKGKDVAK